MKVLKTVLEGKHYYSFRDNLKEVKRYPMRMVKFLEDAEGGKWIEDKLNPEDHGGGVYRLRKVDEFPTFEAEKLSKSEYYGQDAFVFAYENLELVRKVSEDRKRYYRDKQGNFWLEEYVSNLKTDGILKVWLHRIDRFPWD